MDEYDRKAQLERDLQEYDFDVKAWDKDSATGKVWGCKCPDCGIECTGWYEVPSGKTTYTPCKHVVDGTPALDPDQQ